MKNLTVFLLTCLMFICLSAITDKPIKHIVVPAVPKIMVTKHVSLMEASDVIDEYYHQGFTLKSAAPAGDRYIFIVMEKY